MSEPVLNELSLEPAGTSTEDRLRGLMKTIYGLDALGYPRLLRHVADAVDREIEPGTSLRTFLFQRASRELKQALAGRLQKPPYIEELHDEQERSHAILLEASLNGVPARGLGVAHLRDAPALSVPGPRWEIDPIHVRLRRCDGEQPDEEALVEVVHLYCPERVARREGALRERLLRAVRSGGELWARRGELFPRLQFCAVVEKQLLALTGNEFFFEAVVRALACLERALSVWTTGPLHPGMDHSPESPTTLDHPDYGPMRNFVCPDQVIRQFKNHLKLFSCNWRIYYLESRTDAGGRAYVGYVGRHLPTVKYSS